MAAAHDIERNKNVIRRFYEESHNGNLEIYDELFAPEFASYTSATGKPLIGPEAFKQAYIMYTSAFPDFNTTIDMIIAENDLVMVYGPASGTHEGNFMGLEPTGKKLEWTGVAIYRFNDAGMIDARWQEIDGLRLFAQLGLIPAMFAGG
ncbi:MAG: ester cyclase [Chloroflexota bacterium]